MDYQVDQAVRILVRTPDVLRSLLGEAGPEWTNARTGGDTFSPFMESAQTGFLALA